MKRNITHVFVLLIANLFVSNSLFAEKNFVNNGFIDLSETNWDNSPYIKLEGTWDFYWQQFIEPGGTEDSVIGSNRLFAQLPGSWTKVALEEGIKCPSQGYGTYRLRIKFPNKDRVYVLKMFSVFSAYKMFVNGELTGKVGKIGKSKESSVPKFLTQEIPFVIQKKGRAETQIAEIIIQVANYHHRKAGLKDPIHIGTIDEVIDQTQNSIIINILLIGIILIIGLNHVLMYMLRRLDFENLIFGILATVMILRNLTTGERLLLHWFPNMSWEMLVRLDNFSGFATITFFSFYFYFTYRSDFPKTIFYFILAIGTLITALVFSTNAWFYGQFSLLFIIYIGLGGLYLVFGVLFVAAIRKRLGGLVTFIGMFLLYATAINDSLSSMGILKTTYIAPYGIAAFMLLQSFLLTKKSAIALKENQSLSGELKLEKLKLEERINERTKELSKQASELEKHRKVQEKQNWVNENLNSLNEIMRQNKDNLNMLADSLLSSILKNIEATMGALYFQTKDDDIEQLKLIAHYGLSSEILKEELDLKEGLVGKCFTSGKHNSLSDLPEGFFEISSGLGKSTPKELTLYPLIVDEKTIGVLEIATFKVITDSHKDLIEKAASNIAGQLNIVKMNDETKNMLSNYKHFEQELKQKDEEFRQMKEEIEILRESK